MLTKTPQLKRFLFVLYFALALAVILLTLRAYLGLFHSFEGMVTPSGQPLGGDYIAFYTGGSIVNHPFGIETLYNFKYQREFQTEVFRYHQHVIPFLPFVYPVSVAVLFSFFAQYTFTSSYLLWTLFSILMALLSVEILIRSKDNWLAGHRLSVYIGLAAFTPFTVDTLAGGQLASFGLLVLSAIYYCLKTKRQLFAGLLLALCYYKAPLFLFLGVVLFVTRGSRFRIGVLIGGTALIGAEVIYLGPQLFLHYLSFVADYLTGAVQELNYNLPTNLGVGVWGSLQRLLGESETSLAIEIFAFLAVWLLGMYLALRNFSIDDEFSFALLTILTAALSLQVNNYDVSLLILPVILLVQMFPSFSSRQRYLSVWILALVCSHALGVTGEHILLPAATIGILTYCLLHVRSAAR